MPGVSRLEPNPRHDAYAEVDVVRRVRVEVDEIHRADLGLAGGPFEPQGGVQLPLVVVVELCQERDRRFFLRQYPLRGDLPDVRGGKIHPVVETVLELRQFYPLRVDGGDHLVELLLRRDDDPARCDDPALCRWLNILINCRPARS